MLVKVQLPAQKKEIELLNEVTVTVEVICSIETSVQTEWSLNPKGLRHSTTLPQFLTVILVKKENIFALKLETEIDGVSTHLVLDVESVEEVASFPPVRPRYKR